MKQLQVKTLPQPPDCGINRKFQEFIPNDYGIEEGASFQEVRAEAYYLYLIIKIIIIYISLAIIITITRVNYNYYFFHTLTNTNYVCLYL